METTTKTPWMTEQENKAEVLNGILREIAREMPDATARSAVLNADGYWTMPLIITGGLAVHLSNGNYGVKAGRLVIGGDYGEEKRLRDFTPYNEHMPSITVNPDRGAKVIAKEIERRILPELRTFIAKCRERMREHDDCRQKEQDKTKILAEIGKGVFKIAQKQSWHDGPKEPLPKLEPLPWAKLWGKIDVSADGEIAVELHSISFESAKAVIKALNDTIKK